MKYRALGDENLGLADKGAGSEGFWVSSLASSTLRAVVCISPEYG